MTGGNGLAPKKGPMAFMAGHSVAANLVMLVCLVGGGVAMYNVKQEHFPEITLDVVEVSVSYPGASPEEVERGILQTVEEAVRGLDGVDEISSVAREGSGVVSIELLSGANPDKLSQDVKSEVDRIRTFPEDAEEPQVRVVSRRREVLNIYLYGDVPRHALHELGERARDQLLQDPRITQVELEGVPPLEISIDVPQENLQRYGLTLREIATRLQQQSVDVPAGGVKAAGGEVLVRVKERRDFGREFARLPVVSTADGGEVLLKDLAEVEDAFEDTDRYTLFNGKPSVELEVYRVGDQTPISVSRAVREVLPEIQSWLPPGVEASIQRDRSDSYRQRLELLVKNMGLGLVLVLIVLGLFLEARLAFWVMMGIPISFIGSFLFLPLTGVTINMISLFAYIIALGIVVDDAIVVGENVYHYRQEGMPYLQAAVRGAREVAMPVTFSILTNIATFLPIAFIPGVMGNIFRMIPIVVTVVFLVSLLESLFVLPAHLAHQKPRHRRGVNAWLHARQQAFSEWFAGWVRNRYGPFLEFCLRHRYLTVTAAGGLLTVFLAYAVSGRMGFSQFPKVESDFSEASLIMPYGTPVQKTEAVLRRIVDGARRVIEQAGREELVESIVMDVGRGGSHVGRVQVNLARPGIRDKIMSNDAFTKRWRQVVGDVAGAESMRFASDVGGPGGRSRPVEVQLSHRQIDVLREVSTELTDILATYPRSQDVDNGFRPGKQQLDFTVKPEGKALGLTAQDISRQVRAALYGAEVLRQQRGRNEIKVMVRLPREDRATEQTLRDMLVRTPGGTFVPLREVAERVRSRAYTTIDRRAGRRVVSVTADVTPRSEAGEILSDLETNVLPDLMRNHPGLQYSFEGQQADIRESLGSLQVSFAIALMAIYAMLAIPFRSYTQPLIVMVSIPFGIVGAFLGHLIMGYDLALPSIFGIVALSGVVVNDSLVMVDFANRRRREDGMNYHDSIVSAGIQRFRPIMLTTLTTFGGLAPMIFETSRQARFLIPMALSLGYGILFATLITLVLVPSLYMAVEDFHRFARKGRRLVAPPAPAPELDPTPAR